MPACRTRVSPQYPRVLLLGGAHRRGGRLLWKLLGRDVPVGVDLRVERGMGSQSGSADAGAHNARHSPPGRRASPPETPWSRRSSRRRPTHHAGRMKEWVGRRTCAECQALAAGAGSSTGNSLIDAPDSATVTSSAGAFLAPLACRRGRMGSVLGGEWRSATTSAHAPPWLRGAEATSARRRRRP